MILILEDDYMNQDWMGRYLTRLGVAYEFVTTVDEFEAALDREGAAWSKYMLDYQVPGERQGDEAARILEARGVFPGQVVGMSGLRRPEFPSWLYQVSKSRFKEAVWTITGLPAGWAPGDF